MRKVLFLDRDGVINSDVGHYYIYKKEDFKINDGIIDALLLAISKGYDIVIITNQGGVAKGEYSKHEVAQVHDFLLQSLDSYNINPLEIYYCPHHDKIEKCLCRKPSGLMITKAISRFNIDKECSFMIGDNMKDVLAAQDAGINGFLVAANENILPLVTKIIYER